MKNQTNSTIKGLIALSLLLMVSCQSKTITTDGFFAQGSKEIKESLVGKWEITSADPTQGTVLYEFTQKDDKTMSLKVKGEEKKILDFNSEGLNHFTFSYAENGKPVLVVGQFNANDRKSLVCVQETDDAASDSKFMKLERKIPVRTVTASINNKN